MSGSDRILTRLMGLHPKIIDLSLDRMWRLLDRLGNPQDHLPDVVHVAGTNGKGSTIAMLRAGLEAAGQRVHVYTSPHLVRFHERIRLAGDLIGEDALADLLAECEAANGDAPITYFEITTAAALLAFARTPADVTLLEVGLGGRLDATNVVARPRLTVITRIDMDHEQYLGTTLAAIAGEKAGIVKPGVPLVTCRQHDAAMAVVEATAERAGAPLRVEGQDWLAWIERDRLVFQDDRGLLDLPPPALQGPHQTGNAGTALAALRALGVAEETPAAAAMTGAEWPARMQRLGPGPLAALAPDCEIWLDGGHNPAAGHALAATLAARPPRPTWALCGMLETKDASGFLGAIAPQLDGLIAVTIPDAEASRTAVETAAAARDVGLSADVAPDLAEALRAASARAGRVVICGSLYLAGAVLRANAPEASPRGDRAGAV